MNKKIYLVNSLDLIPARLLVGGNLFSLPNGEVFEFNGDSDQLGGAKSFFKKLGIVALGAAGAIAAPFTGGLSLAAAATLTSAVGAAGAVAGGLLGGTGGGGGVKTKDQPSGIPDAIAAWDQQLAGFENQITSGQADKSQLDSAVEQQWHALHEAVNQIWKIKHHVEQPKAAGYHAQIDEIKTKWNSTKNSTPPQIIAGQTVNPAAIVPVGQTQTGPGGQTQYQQLPNGQIALIQNAPQPQQENTFGGFSNQSVLIGIGVVGLILFLKK